MRLARGLVLAALGLGGCTLLVDLDVTGGSPDGGRTLEASASADASVAEDAPSNDGSPAEVPDASICGESFCDDFDHYGKGVLWSGASLVGGTVRLEDVAYSPPRALLATTQAGQTGAQALLFRNFEPRPKFVRCRYRVQAITMTVLAELSGFALTAPGLKYYTIVLQSLPAGLRLVANVAREDGGTFYYESPAQAPIPTDKWLDVSISADFGTRRLNASVDGTVIAFDVAIPESSDDAKLSVGAGITWQESSGTNAYRFDDYRCTITP